MVVVTAEERFALAADRFCRALVEQRQIKDPMTVHNESLRVLLNEWFAREATRAMEGELTLEADGRRYELRNPRERSDLR